MTNWKSFTEMTKAYLRYVYNEINRSREFRRDAGFENGMTDSGLMRIVDPLPSFPEWLLQSGIEGGPSR